MNSQTILSLYQALTETGRQMHAAARAQEWNQFIALAEQLADQTVDVQTSDVGIALTSEEAAQKRDLIERYLAFDTEIKTAIAPRMAVLASIVNATGTANIIHNLYGNTP